MFGCPIFFSRWLPTNETLGPGLWLGYTRNFTHFLRQKCGLVALVFFLSLKCRSRILSISSVFVCLCRQLFVSVYSFLNLILIIFIFVGPLCRSVVLPSQLPIVFSSTQVKGFPTIYIFGAVLAAAPASQWGFDGQSQNLQRERGESWWRTKFFFFKKSWQIVILLHFSYFLFLVKNTTRPLPTHFPFKFFFVRHNLSLCQFDTSPHSIPSHPWTISPSHFDFQPICCRKNQQQPNYWFHPLPSFAIFDVLCFVINSSMDTFQPSHLVPIMIPTIKIEISWPHTWVASRKTSISNLPPLSSKLRFVKKRWLGIQMVSPLLFPTFTFIFIIELPSPQAIFLGSFWKHNALRNFNISFTPPRNIQRKTHKNNNIFLRKNQTKWFFLCRKKFLVAWDSVTTSPWAGVFFSRINQTKWFLICQKSFWLLEN